MAPSTRQAIEEQLTQLRDTSFVAHREIEQVLPAIRPHGDEVTLAWILACRKIFDYDREAGKAFIHGSLEAERAAANADTSIFMAHGSYDAVIPEALAVDSTRALEAHGYAVEWHSYPMEHMVCAEEIGDISRWIGRCVGAAAAS